MQIPSPTSFALAESGHAMAEPHDVSELIYSRTDKRGVILAANDIFQRVAGYDREEFIGAPHRLVRHPDMPKGFFHLFWNLLKQNEPAVGYVKNQSKSGRFYWVLAAVFPCEDGYFSVRIKPTSAFFQTVQAEYAKQLTKEMTEGLTPEASASAMLARFHELGFESYAQVMAHAIIEETQGRALALGLGHDPTILHLLKLQSKLDEAIKMQSKLMSLLSGLTFLPANMRLIAGRLETQEGPISQISKVYKDGADEISVRLTSFVVGKDNLCGKMATTVRRGIVLDRCAKLHRELVDSEDKELTPTGSQDIFDKEMQVIEKAGAHALKLRAEAMIEAEVLAQQLTRASSDVRRMVIGLDTIRILGRVESRRNDTADRALGPILDQIDQTQAAISECLGQLSVLSADISSIFDLMLTRK